MALSFSALESFYWVAQLRNFSAAAEKLHITQPTVSYRIRELEEHLGVSLFVRQKRGLLLTSEGEALKRYAESMIGIARDIESNIRTRNTRLPTLRVGVMDSFAVVCLPALLNELDIRFAGTRVAATVDTSPALIASCPTSNCWSTAIPCRRRGPLRTAGPGSRPRRPVRP